MTKTRTLDMAKRICDALEYFESSPKACPDEHFYEPMAVNLTTVEFVEYENRAGQSWDETIQDSSRWRIRIERLKD